MARPLIILGTGGSALDVLDVIESINAGESTWHVAGFLDDARPVGSSYLEWPILGRLVEANHFREHLFINAIGSDKSYRKRPDILASTELPAERFATLVHAGASISTRARLGRGICVNHGVTVAGSVVVGNHVTLCPGSVVGHNAVIEDFSLIAPGAVISGFVRVGQACYVGAGSVIRQQVRIGSGALIGMGAVVLNDVDDGSTVVGNPARVLSGRAAIL
jgi:sugar O-acyltransferase (sialic acid O-acetyltransferase NeuD family)